MIPEDLSALSTNQKLDLQGKILARVSTLEAQNRKAIEFWTKHAPKPAELALRQAEADTQGLGLNKEYIADWVLVDQQIRNLEDMGPETAGLQATDFGLYTKEQRAKMTEVRTGIQNMMAKVDSTKSFISQNKLIPRIKVLIGNQRGEHLLQELIPMWNNPETTPAETALVMELALDEGLEGRMNEITEGMYALGKMNIAVEDQMLVKLAKDSSEVFLDTVLAQPERYGGLDGKYSALRKLIPNFDNWWKAVEAWLKSKGVENPNVPEQHKLMDDVAPFAPVNTEIECR